MRVLNLEDDVYKHNDICKVLRSCAQMEIDCAKNLEEGLHDIQNQFELGKPYDLIITDMWYPQKAGTEEQKSGEQLMQIAKERGWNIPIILCSSVNYRFPEIHGTIHYSSKGDWENGLRKMVKELL